MSNARPQSHPIRDEVVATSVTIERLRQEREAVARQLAALDHAIAQAEVRLDEVLGGVIPADGTHELRRESPFGHKVLQFVRTKVSVTAIDIAGGIGEPDTKRIHNALRTLEKGAWVAKVGRGRWQAVLKCNKCGRSYSAFEGRCPDCGLASTERNSESG